MKAILIIIAALLSPQLNAQNYYLKETTSVRITESGKHYSKSVFSYVRGTVSLGERLLYIKQENHEERIYTLNFEPLRTEEGFYFTANFKGRTSEFWYNRECGYLLLKRGAYLSYYHFETD